MVALSTAKERKAEKPPPSTPVTSLAAIFSPASRVLSATVKRLVCNGIKAITKKGRFSLANAKVTRNSTETAKIAIATTDLFLAIG